jgi:hypothetical protein
LDCIKELVSNWLVVSWREISGIKVVVVPTSN